MSVQITVAILALTCSLVSCTPLEVPELQENVPFEVHPGITILIVPDRFTPNSDALLFDLNSGSVKNPIRKAYNMEMSINGAPQKIFGTIPYGLGQLGFPLFGADNLMIETTFFENPTYTLSANLPKTSISFPNKAITDSSFVVNVEPALALGDTLEISYSGFRGGRFLGSRQLLFFEVGLKKCEIPASDMIEYTEVGDELSVTVSRITKLNVQSNFPGEVVAFSAGTGSNVLRRYSVE